MSDTATAPLTVAEAKARYDEAVGHLDDLTSRMKSGDTSIPRDELDDARRDAEYAELALQGARAREARQAQEELREWCEDFKGRARAAIDAGNRAVAERCEPLREALTDLFDAVGEANTRRHSLSVEWEDRRPEDVPLDPKFNRDLPDFYRDAKLSRIHSHRGQIDELKLAVGVLIDVLSERRNGRTREETEEFRHLHAFGDHELRRLNDARDYANTKGQ